MGTETPPTQRTGPARAVVARDYIGPLTKAVTTCFPCEFLTHRGGQSYCRHEPMNGAHIGRTGGTYETPPTCPLLPAARLALARRIVAEADAVLCSKCGKPVTTADEKSYRMHSMAGCPR